MPPRSRYVDLREGAYDLGDGIRLSATYLNHPLLCMGYRIEYRGRVLCTAFDTEPFRNVFITDPADPRYDEVMAQEGEQAVQAAALRMNAFLREADLLIHDGQFTEQEYRAGRVGWGHSSVEHAIGLAEASGARRLALVHHDPMRTDAGTGHAGAALRRRAAGLRAGGLLRARRAVSHPLMIFVGNVAYALISLARTKRRRSGSTTEPSACGG
ncbi:MAG: MBL fold metallo-hydrolase [Desulfobacterales bacterium]|nr:MBL fold metallo-hydrolase [Desulfobacterales bacterium]